METEGLSATLIPTYGNNGLENYNTADTDFIQIPSQNRWDFLYFKPQNHA